MLFCNTQTNSKKQGERVLYNSTCNIFSDDGFLPSSNDFPSKSIKTRSSSDKYPFDDPEVVINILSPYRAEKFPEYPGVKFFTPASFPYSIISFFKLSNLLIITALYLDPQYQ